MNNLNPGDLIVASLRSYENSLKAENLLPASLKRPVKKPEIYGTPIGNIASYVQFVPTDSRQENSIILKNQLDLTIDLEVSHNSENKRVSIKPNSEKEVLLKKVIHLIL